MKIFTTQLCALFTLFSANCFSYELPLSQEINNIYGSVYEETTGSPYILFKKELIVKFREDDDIYFQNGVQVLSGEFNNQQIFCSIDTDIELEYIGYKDQYLEITASEFIIRPGFQIPIFNRTSDANLIDGRIFFELDLGDKNGNKYHNALDNLDCMFPFSFGKNPTVGDFYRETGDLFSIHQ
jgi:hypothetical protein